MNETINSSSQIPLLTFNSLYNLLREEKTKKQLQGIDKNFYVSMNNFLTSKKDEIKTLLSHDNEKLSKEKHLLIKSKEIITELINLRLMKISNIAIKNSLYGESTVSIDNILEEEKHYYLSMVKEILKIKVK